MTADSSNLDNNIEVKVLSPEEQTGDLKQRIEKVAQQVGDFYAGYMTVRKTIKESLEEIVHLGIHTYQMEQIQLRNLIDDTFAEKRVSLSYLRKLLPDVLKMTVRTNKRYLKDNQAEGQQALEETTSSPVLEGMTESTTSNVSTDTDIDNTTTGEDYGQLVTSEYRPEPQHQEIQKVLVPEHLIRDYRTEIRKLRQQIQTLQSQVGEIFTAKAIVEIQGSQIPVVVTVDPKKQQVRSVEADDDTIKKIAQNQVRNAKK